MKYRKLNKLEEKADREQRLKDALFGEGIYVYMNNTRGDLDLPKPTASGKKRIAPGEQFQGDNYFMKFVPTMLRYIREIAPPQPRQPAVALIPINEETTMSEQKLILDQPNRVTNQGHVEQVIPQPQKQLNEGQPKPNQPMPEVLINEDPMDGVEIILG